MLKKGCTVRNDFSFDPKSSSDFSVNDDIYVDQKVLAEIFGVSSRTFEGQRQRGEGPPYTKVGRLVRYHLGTAKKYYAERTLSSTSMENAA